ncbi:hypothetical protein [Brevibacillus borstelensis]|uniref:hypothetical protein n=1 Tax=Brevibacillus borstelensis TaxID=45462 RepID=UPI00287FC0C6|nr:hypothetical protein [Brevibacillus borstelensis]WNF04868.1 hypothetical protein RFB14_21205 [Brevibacillus borstelensis]
MGENQESIWANQILDKAQLVMPETHEQNLADTLIDLCYNAAKRTNVPVGIALAASFDLLVGAEYYRNVINRGWCYCPEHQSLIFPYTNTCPACVLSGKFHFHRSNKPESGKIGTATSRLLCVFLDRLFVKSSRNFKIFKGSEPIDILIHDEQKNIMLLAEVKAAPLITLPLLVRSEEKITDLVDGEIVEIPHSAVDNSSLSSSNICLLLPVFHDGSWQSKFVELQTKDDILTNTIWAYGQLENIFRGNNDLFDLYLDTWKRAFEAYQVAYHEKDRSSNIFWLTNACGQPKPRPVDWPARSGTGYESVSDGKTSVGMDRTDDIKKGIYQVLKLGAESKPINQQYQIKTALISNIHAARHYDEYLTSLQDVVWALDETGLAKKAGELDSETPIYNLFDGIISFTRNHPRDEWIRENFQF